MSGITSAIPYAFSALAQIKWRIVDRRAMHVLGIPVYFVQRGKMTRPEPVPEYR